MKKVIYSLILSSSVIFFSAAVAIAEVKETDQSVATEQVEKNRFDLVTKEVINIGGKGQLKLEDLEVSETKIEFIPLKTEGIELKADGTYVGLKSGEFTFTPKYVVKEENTQKNKLSKNSFPEVTVEVRNQKQVFYEVKGEYKLDKASYLVGEAGKIIREPFEGIQMTGEFKPIKASSFELTKEGDFKSQKVGKEIVTAEYVLSAETEKNLKLNYIKNAKEELTVDDITINDNGKTSSLGIEVKEKEMTPEKVTLEIVKAYSVDKSTLEVGETTQVKVKALKEIELTGEYKVIDNANVSLDRNGRLVVKKAENTTIHPELMLSENSKRAVKEQYMKDSGRDNLTLENITIVEKNQEEPLVIQVNKKEEPKAGKLSIDVTPAFSLNKQNFQVGETGGKLTVNPLYGVQVKGAFKEIKNQVIDFKTDGSFIGIQAGSVELVPSFEIEQESLDEIANAFLKKSENAHLTRQDVEFVYKDVQPVFSITFTSLSGNNNSGGKSAKNYVPVEKKRTLPQTGETRSLFISILGAFSLLGSGFIFKHRF